MSDLTDSTDPYAAWHHALAEADRVFASPPSLDRPVGGCARCTPAAELLLLAGDPASVPDDVLGHFLREVAEHWDADQYPVLWRRLLPRALRHWGPGGQSAEPAPEIGRLSPDGAAYARWPAAERAAVDGALRALLALALADGRPAGDVLDLLEGMAHATGTAEPWLAHLASCSGPAADAGLVRLALGWSADLLWEDLGFAWWYDGDPSEIAGWLLTQRPRIASFAARHPRCKTAADALAGLDHLRAGAPYSPWAYPHAGNLLLRTSW
ncbi:hypothetical protein [Streptomyces genisteinicus]|uniref:Uncharacterized protein n=1 Tax=Streptomyces genisteinicus TaxID=2768068 RepID=A0A7H0I4U7_9ACTN|nr:hypothetical protein [Streptomyces genisteinicus]QNP67813.1 hypothetical protein IAG43_32930 [Streptomyces genisteinicus]